MQHRQKYVRNNNWIFRAIENRMGKIAVVTDLAVSWEVVYDILKTRVDIEQCYDTFKNTIHADRTYVRDGCSTTS